MSLPLTPKTFFVASGLVFLVGAGAIYTGYTGLTELEGRVAALKLEAKDEKEIQTQLAGIVKANDELRGKLRHLEQGVPQFAYIPSMTKELELVGKRNGIEVLGIRPMITAKTEKAEGDSKERPAYEELTIQVKGRGGFLAVKRFVQSLTRFPKIVEVRMLTLSPKIDPKTPGAPPRLDAEIEIRAYAFKETGPKVETEKIAQLKVPYGS